MKEPTMERTRRNFTPQQKVSILREHLVEHVPVSDVYLRAQPVFSIQVGVWLKVGAFQVLFRITLTKDVFPCGA
jgi:hypothetical protein